MEAAGRLAAEQRQGPSQRNDLAVDQQLEGQRQGGLQADDAEGGTGAPLSASIDQCEEISRHVGLTLEVEDVIPTAYVLEVSSPGRLRRLDRELCVCPRAGNQRPLPEHEHGLP